jgi:hypothetical protein
MQKMKRPFRSFPRNPRNLLQFSRTIGTTVGAPPPYDALVGREATRGSGRGLTRVELLQGGMLKFTLAKREETEWNRVELKVD